MDGSYRRTQPRAPSFDGPMGGAKPSRDPYLTRVVIMVDEATEPGLTDEQATKHRSAIVSLLLNRGHDMPPSLHNTDPGPAVAYAIRKRLKSEDELAVLSTLTLLDELMRVVPYFYRQIANEKFFRRLWRFVVPDYKNGMKSMIPIFGKPKLHAGYRDHSEVANRVKILIRAWAEELSVMFEGRYEPHAGFLIERYNNKRTRVQFPPVPRTETPWVCPVDLTRLSSYFKETKGRPSTEEAITLAGAENTVELFANLVENADRIDDLKVDVCKELAQRCMHISKNLHKLSMSMSKEEELARAIAVSEKLHKALELYNRSLSSGKIERAIPVVDSASLESDDERYDGPGPRQFSSRSLERYNSMPPRSARYSDSSEFSSAGRHDSVDRERARPRGDDRPTRDRMESHKSALDRRGVPKEEREERSRPREFVRSTTVGPVSRRGQSPERRGGAKSAEKRERRELPKPKSRREKSDSELPKLTKEKKKAQHKKKGLIPVEDDSSSESSSEEEENNAEAFAMLAERYSTKGKQKQRIRNRDHKSSKVAKQSLPQASNAGAASSSNSAQSLPPISNMSINPAAAYYSSVPGMGYNPMMMVPNPYAMYGSVGHVPVQDPMGMFNAYQTVNPAMYYNSVNPQMYSSFTPNMPGVSPLSNFQVPGSGAPPNAGQPSSVQKPLLPGPAAASNVSSTQSERHQLLSDTSQSQQQQKPTGAVPTPQLMNSFYSSVPGAPIMPQPVQPLMARPGFMPTSQDAAPSSASAVPTPSTDGQAAAYRNAMNQAAVAYHAAAAMYRSVQGETPIVPHQQQPPSVQPPTATNTIAFSGPSSTSETAVADTLKEEETKQ
ncbi:hypothetical protein BWQ96_06306 [Gracilariopsis chorda]|uniref:VHS domain-containing protein n=1 Tax=Gracilariopsis chorda TaxID=448386 RepID=A0A2V3IPF8_9FLOR|nr:hypothetical protein BWQ96_06306 [Gracilariopsis chorda]|eukprot:PXF43937.1 hypothetical protein BWQ96_06306 [Gracilariopsis chorda]